MRRRNRNRTWKGASHQMVSGAKWDMAVRIILLVTFSILFLVLIGVSYNPKLAKKFQGFTTPDDIRPIVSNLPLSSESQITGIALVESSSASALSIPISHNASTQNIKFVICGRKPVTCVVDGDTFWLDGVKIRIADIDTPEIRNPQCATERRLGIKATNRLIDLLNAGPFEIQSSGGREYDRYGRLLRIIVRDGKSLGEQLEDEGLAHSWGGHKRSWCYQ